MKTLSLSMLCFFLFSSTVYADSSDQRELLVESVQVLEEVQSSPDHQIPASLVSKAKAIIVFPTMLKGGFAMAREWRL